MEVVLLGGNISTEVVCNRDLVNPDKYPNNILDHITQKSEWYMARDPLGINVGFFIAFLRGGL